MAAARTRVAGAESVEQRGQEEMGREATGKGHEGLPKVYKNQNLTERELGSH